MADTTAPASSAQPVNTSWWGIIKAAGADWMEDKSTKLAAALAFYTMLSIGPMLLLCITIVGKLFDDTAARRQIEDYVERGATDRQLLNRKPVGTIKTEVGLAIAAI